VQLTAEKNAEVRTSLTNSDLPRLRSVCRVDQKPVSAGEHVVQREYELKCKITEVDVHIAPKTFQFVGYGEKASVSNFQKIVSHILTADLNALTEAVANVPWKPWGTQPSLNKATMDFIDSEVNIEIHEKERKEAHVRDQTIDSAYADQAVTILQSALGRLYFAKIGPSLAVQATFIPLFLVVSHFTKLGQTLGGWGDVILASVVCVLLFIFGMNAHSQFAGELANHSSEPSKARQMIDGRLSSYFNFWKFHLTGC
jgi:hypothetical protein